MHKKEKDNTLKSKVKVITNEKKSKIKTIQSEIKPLRKQLAQIEKAASQGE